MKVFICFILMLLPVVLFGDGYTVESFPKKVSSCPNYGINLSNRTVSIISGRLQVFGFEVSQNIVYVLENKVRELSGENSLISFYTKRGYSIQKIRILPKFLKMKNFQKKKSLTDEVSKYGYIKARGHIFGKKF